MRKLSIKLFAMCGLGMGLVACGDDSTPAGDTNTPTDTDTSNPSDTDTTTPTDTDTTSPDTDTTVPDTDTTADTTTPDTVGPTCDRDEFTVNAAFFEYNADNDFTNFGAESDSGFISVEFYDIGSGSPLTGVGVYPIGGNAADRNYETCSTCIVIYDDCGAETCDTLFFATGGTIEVTAIDQDAGTITAELKDIVAVEVTIDSQTFRSTPVANGESYCLDSVPVVYDPECTTDAMCTEAGKPFCDTESNTCVQCLGAFDCPTAAAPVCVVANDTLVCGTQTDVCTGDDTLEPNNGPAQATALVAGTPVNAKACVGTTSRETDWFTFTTTEVSNLNFSVTHAAATAMDFDIVLFSADGEVVDAAESEDNPEVLTVPLAPVGTYYAVVYLYTGSDTAGVDYTFSFTATVPECQTNTDCTEAGEAICDTTVGECVVCATSFDCGATTPVCQADDAGVRSCTVVDVCTGDDATHENNDDGPSGATPLVLGTPMNSKVCGEDGTPSESESDFYILDLTTAGNVRFTLTWAGESDLDLYLFGEDGTFIDGSVLDSPEVLDAPALAVGKYYVQIISYEGNATAAIDYSIGAASF